MDAAETLAIPIPEQPETPAVDLKTDLDLTTVGDITVPDPRMKVRNVDVFYGEKQAIFDVSLDIGSKDGGGHDRPVGLRQDPPSCAASTG